MRLQVKISLEGKSELNIPQHKSALRFVLLIGAVSFFADFTYEGARSVYGPFLAGLGQGQRRAPGTAEDLPALNAQMFAKLLNVFYQVPRGVIC